MTRWTCALLVLLTGCPMPGSGPAPQSPGEPGATAAAAVGGCPAPDHIYVASYLASDDPAQPAMHTGWVLPLHDEKVDSVTAQPEYMALDPTAASARGVPPPPSSAWLMTPGQAPCRATVGPYYAAAIDGPSPNVSYGVELDGCAAPPKDQQDDAEAIVLVTDQPPTDCQLLGPQPVAARVGDSDAQKHWQRPTRETPLPAAIAAIVPPHDCQAPGCETLWAFGEVDVAGRPAAWAGAVNWLTIPPGATAASQCDWKADTFAGFFVPGPDGRAVKVTEQQDHPLLLSAVLADRSGPRALIAEGPGEYTTYDPSGHAVRHLVWLRLAPEAYTIDERIGPSCSSDDAASNATTPAPLPLGPQLPGDPYAPKPAGPPAPKPAGPPPKPR